MRLSGHLAAQAIEVALDGRTPENLEMAGRDPRQVVAATRIVSGADVNYGALTRNPGFPVKDKIVSLVMLIAAFFIFINFVVDLLYAAFDPRVRYR